MTLFLFGILIALLGVLITAVGYLWLVVHAFRASTKRGFRTMLFPLRSWFAVPETESDPVPAPAWVLMAGLAWTLLGLVAVLFAAGLIPGLHP